MTDLHRLLSRSLAVLSFFVISVSVGHAKGRKPPNLAFVLEPSTVTAGRTLSIQCRSNVPLRNPSITFNDRKAFFHSTGPREWRALLGIHSMEPSGEKPAVFFAEWGGRRVVESTVIFQVEDGTYPVSRVLLSAQKDQLVASGQMERDAETLERFYQPAAGQERLWLGYFIMPTTGVVSSLYGARRAYGQRARQTAHTGLDIANDEGTPVAAPNRGRVVFAEWLDSFGNSVVLDHGGGVFSYYLHMQQSHVQIGAVVEKGDPLGLMGAEGVATGPHLHWSLVVAGERVDPREWTERDFGAAPGAAP